MLGKKSWEGCWNLQCPLSHSGCTAGQCAQQLNESKRSRAALRSSFIQLTVTNALGVGVTENSVLVPISKITSLIKEGLWKILRKAGVMNKLDIQVIKNLKILNNKILLSSKYSHSTRIFDGLSQVQVHWYTHYVFQIVRSLVQERLDCVEKASMLTCFGLELGWSVKYIRVCV